MKDKMAGKSNSNEEPFTYYYDFDAHQQFTQFVDTIYHQANDDKNKQALQQHGKRCLMEGKEILGNSAILDKSWFSEWVKEMTRGWACPLLEAAVSVTRVQCTRSFLIGRNDDLNIESLIQEFRRSERPQRRIRLGYSILELLKLYGYNCALSSDVQDLTNDEVRVRDAMAMEFVSVTNFADYVINVCNNHLEIANKKRMPYTKFLHQN